MTDGNDGAANASREEDVRPNGAAACSGLPVSGSELLGKLSAALQNYVFLSPEQADAIALWTLQTHVVATAAYAPRLAITSALPRCGKSRLLEILEPLVCNPISSGSLTGAVVFRVIEASHEPPTLLIDEGDTFLNEADVLTGILNMGHRSRGTVMRCVGNDHTPKAFKVFSPVAIAMIGKLSPALSDRCIRIRMQRAGKDERRPTPRKRDIAAMNEMGRLCAKWALENRSALTELEPSLPDWLVDRAANNWETLFAIAQLSGASWVERAKNAAKTLEKIGQEEALTESDRLLSDIRRVFEDEKKDRISSRLLCERLNRLEESSWQRMEHGRGLDPNRLAELLEPYGIKPKTIRLGEKETPRGYKLEQFDDAFRRYLSPSKPAEHDNDTAGANT